MPSFSVEDIDIDPSEFVYACNKYEIGELIEALIDDGYIDEPIVTEPDRDNLIDISFKEALSKLQHKRIYLTLEEEQFIINLANKF
jgi:hypothetical protein